MMDVADPDAVHAVRVFIRKQIAQELKGDLISTVNILALLFCTRKRCNVSNEIIELAPL